MSTPKLKPAKPLVDREGQPIEIIKRVKAYPIETELFKDGAPTPRKVSIVKLTEFGFLIKAESTVGFFKVNENYEVSFTLPVTHRVITANVKVVKTYDAVDNPFTKTKIYTVELHFLNLDGESKVQISDFLKKIGQKE